MRRDCPPSIFAIDWRSPGTKSSFRPRMIVANSTKCSSILSCPSSPDRFTCAYDVSISKHPAPRVDRDLGLEQCGPPPQSAFVARRPFVILFRHLPVQYQQPARYQPSRHRFIAIFDDEVLICFQHRHVIDKDFPASVYAVVYREPPQTGNRLKAAPDLPGNCQLGRRVNEFCAMSGSS